MNLYDSLRREAVTFQPQDPGRVTVYGCGPTVYDFAHVGNFRSFLVYDLLHRHLRSRGHAVEFVVNFTDVDDKTIAGAVAAGASLNEHTAPFVEAFLDDARTLGLVPFSQHPRATSFVPEMAAFVERLVEQGHAYAAPDGSVYYSVPSFARYGRLSGGRDDEAEARSRVKAAEGKRDDRDFVLWKAARAEDRQAGAVWDSPWGPGRPGWHLECSVMAAALLGPTIDIHLGGEDLLFPHHENEIAQSEGATGQPFVRFWLHVKHLKVEGRKMSKSLGNIRTVRELVAQGAEPAALRWVLLSAHYRNELNFTAAGLKEASVSVQRLLDFRRRATRHPTSEAARRSAAQGLADAARARLAAFGEALDQDLNVPQALAALWGLVRETHAALDQAPHGVTAAAKKAVLGALAEMDDVLGVLDLAEQARADEGQAEEKVRGLVEARDQARAARDFAAADRLRDELAAMGVRLEDTPEGTRWSRIRPAG